MSVKRITVRVSPELHERVSQAAVQNHVSLNQFVVEALETYVRHREAEAGQWPLRELSALLAPTAEASDISKEELMRHVREVRRRIWEERYQAAMRVVESEVP
ncbi:MAG: YlcI/YnfO family protein [Anaerolineae bacterium]